MTITALLLRWYGRHGRNLPWRKTRNAYRVLVSEVMLQQTQVPRVLLFYKIWLKQFPDWKTLARASNARVIRAWSGLGYNRRALVLRDIAVQIKTRGIPTTEDDWLSLKGIGPYTAAALACFSLRKRSFPLDTNTRRVGGRLFLGRAFATPKTDERLRREAAKKLLSTKNFFDVPQALFDLATLVCKKSPLCTECPLQQHCPSAKKFLFGRIHIPRASIQKPLEKKHRNKSYPDRIYRGRILKLAGQKTHGVSLASAGRKIDSSFQTKRDRVWLLAMLERMEKDGLILMKNKRISLSTKKQK